MYCMGNGQEEYIQRGNYAHVESVLKASSRSDNEPMLM